ncbi:dTDP-4-dehydrorhamnose reductase [Nguyenibacter sp. L1]|uniref:dTDP-4-dehydrorhamnose reductase n=1 Tax=Nguyenibacter sp. L1 TaxID=3049350 RepID=UPI0038D1B991
MAGRPGLHRLGRPAIDFDRPETLDAALEAALDTAAPGLVVPGLVVPGLVVPGLVVPGLVVPGLVVNAAAWTAVDAAEQEVAAAERANRDGPARLAELCAARAVPLIHVSTDYVFDGTKGTPYAETDPTSPRTVYGRTKLDGERAILQAHDRAIILRTAWVYSPYGRNFVRTMLDAATKRPVLRVVGDQRGNPTSADDLAAAILAIAERIGRTGWQAGYAGLFHAAGTGDTTWHGLATAALEDAARAGHKMPEIQAIATADWPTPAARPADSRLDCTRLHDVFGVRLPHWRNSVAKVVATLTAPAT